MKRTAILTIATVALAVGGAGADTQADYAKKIDDLLAGMGSDDLTVRQEKQAAFEGLCHAAATPGKEADRVALGKAIADKLGPDSPAEARVWMLRRVQQFGRAEMVDCLAGLLGDEDERIGRCALRALKNNPAPEAVACLRGQLAKATTDEKRIAFINALGFREDAASVGAIAGHLGAKDELLVEAAAAALGKIGTADAAKALLAARAGKTDWLGDGVTDAALVCAEGLLDKGDKSPAVGVYETLLAPAENARTRVAALQGLAAAGNGKAAATAVAFLKSSDLALQRGAIAALQAMPDAAGKILAGALGDLPAGAKVMALTLLADYPGAAACDAVVGATKDKDEAVRIAAIAAAGRLGDARAVKLLAGIAATTKGAEQGAARSALKGISGKGVDEAILAGVASGDTGARVALIEAVEARRTPGAVAALKTAARDEDSDVRAAAMKALGAVAVESDLPALADLLGGASDAKVAAAAAKAVVSLSGRLPDKDPCVTALLGVLPKAGSEGAKAILGVLGKLGGPKALAAVRNAASGGNEAARDAAVRALTSWPGASAAPDLLGIAKNSSNRTHKVLALRGYVRIVGESQAPAAAKLGKLKGAMDLADGEAEKKMVLSAVGNVAHKDALAFLEPYVEDKNLGAEAKAAGKAIRAALAGPMRVSASHKQNEVRNAVDGKANTRWTTGTPMQGGEWFTIDLRTSKTIRQITLDANKSRNDYPRAYEVYVSDSEKDWGKPVLTGKGNPKGATQIKLKKVSGRHIKIVQTGKAAGNYWSIHELKVDAK